MKKIFLIIALFLPAFLYAQNIDINILKEINLNRNKHLDNTFRFITNSATPISIGIPAALFIEGLIMKDSVTKHNAFYIGASVVFSMSAATLLKYGINRTRPYITYPFIEKITSGGSPSFPSGHTSDAFSLATSVSIAYTKWYIIAPAFLWAGAVGYSRMDLGVHYPSDVLAGAIVGSGSAYLCWKLNQWYFNHKTKK